MRVLPDNRCIHTVVILYLVRRCFYCTKYVVMFIALIVMISSNYYVGYIENLLSVINIKKILLFRRNVPCHPRRHTTEEVVQSRQLSPTHDWYNVRRFPRSDRRSVGVCMMYTASFQIRSTTPTPAQSFKGLSAVLRHVRSAAIVRVFTIYRPPSSSQKYTPFWIFIMSSCCHAAD